MAQDKQLSSLQNELERYWHVLIEHYHPWQIWVFGSLATGYVRPDSDIDLIQKYCKRERCSMKNQNEAQRIRTEIIPAQGEGA